MVTVKLFGTFRLDSGLKVLTLEVKRVKELYPLIIEEIQRRDPFTALTETSFKGCIISVNDKQVGVRTRLRDGDEVWLMPAVAGG